MTLCDNRWIGVQRQLDSELIGEEMADGRREIEDNQVEYVPPLWTAHRDRAVNGGRNSTDKQVGRKQRLRSCGYPRLTLYRSQRPPTVAEAPSSLCQDFPPTTLGNLTPSHSWPTRNYPYLSTWLGPFTEARALT